MLSAAIFGISNIVDSHLISKRLPGLKVYLLLTSLVYLVYIGIFPTLFPLPEALTMRVFLITAASTLLRVIGIIIMLFAFKREEASRVVPIVHTYPIIVAILAIPILGESLQYLHWLAIFLVVIGATMTSAKENPFGYFTFRSKALLFPLISSLLYAMADIMGKYVLGYISFWDLYWFNIISFAGVSLAISLRPSTFRELACMNQKMGAIILIVFNEIMVPAAIILHFLALQRGPVSLVSAILSSRPLFVLIGSVMVNYFRPGIIQWYSGGKVMLVTRFVAIAMIVGGITIVNLN